MEHSYTEALDAELAYRHQRLLASRGADAARGRRPRRPWRGWPRLG